MAATASLLMMAEHAWSSTCASARATPTTSLLVSIARSAFLIALMLLAGCSVMAGHCWKNTFCDAFRVLPTILVVNTAGCEPFLSGSTAAVRSLVMAGLGSGSMNWSVRKALQTHSHASIAAGGIKTSSMRRVIFEQTERLAAGSTWEFVQKILPTLTAASIARSMRPIATTKMVNSCTVASASLLSMFAFAQRIQTTSSAAAFAHRILQTATPLMAAWSAMASRASRPISKPAVTCLRTVTRVSIVGVASRTFMALLDSKQVVGSS
mmetsp:Transcript_127432/g.248314  ORF Transcript_127432/g.248314 Transcript_127432/m.248314 type:complete len:267 (-) Transcript_127432:312-1112(-)